MHSSGSITRKFGPSWKQSTGQTSTQSMYLHLMQLSVTTKVMILSLADESGNFITPPPSAPTTHRRLPTAGSPDAVQTRVRRSSSVKWCRSSPAARSSR